MNLQAGGVVLVAAVAVICFLTYRRRTDRSSLPMPALHWARGVFRRFETSTDDPVDRAATTIVSESKVFNRVLYAPLHVWFQCDPTTRDFMMANPAGIHSQVVERTNELGENEATRRGVKWNTVKGLTMNYPISVGTEDVKVSFAPFQASPFADNAAGDGEPLVWGAEPRLASAFPDDAGVWVGGTIPPPRKAPLPARSVVVSASIAGTEPREAMVSLSETATNFQIGRDTASNMVLPSLPGISARHLMLTLGASGHHVTDISTHGTWLESSTGWKKLPPGTRTQIPAGSRLLLDADQRVVVSIREGEAK